MPVCAHCKSIHLLGKKTPSGNYCSDKCVTEAKLKAAAATIPPGYIERRVSEIHQANCPRCLGPGPIDLHSAHEVWSVIVLTSYKTRTALSCKSCGVKRQLGALAFSGFLGWWGIPFGLIITPVQVIRNIIGMIGGPSAGQPSRQLTELVTRQVATELPEVPVTHVAPPPLPSRAL